VSNRPSEPLLALVREAIRKRGLTTGEVADRASIERGALKRRLSGVEDLSVDDFLRLAQALDLQQEVAGLAGAPPEAGPRTLRAVGPAVIDEPPPLEPERVHGLDPYGSVGKQLVEQGFALGLDMLVHFERARIDNSGVPRAVLADKRFAEALPIRFEPRWHRHNAPEFHDEELVVRLSFDALYTCRFPWAAVRSVSFTVPDESPPAPPPEPEEKKPARPVLRLVKE